MKKLTRSILLVSGSLCVGLGFIGIFLPLLPTTPFLLLASVCYARSSKKFYDWLTTNRVFGKYIRNYREGKGIPFKQKLLTILFLWVTIVSTACYAVSGWWIRAFLMFIAVAVTVHILAIRTWKPDSNQQLRPEKHDVI